MNSAEILSQGISLPSWVAIKKNCTSESSNGLIRSKSLISLLSAHLMSYVSHEQTQPRSGPTTKFEFSPRRIPLVRVVMGLYPWTDIYAEFYLLSSFNTLRLRQNGRHLSDNIFKWISLNENVWISMRISLKFVPGGPIKNIPASVQTMAGRRPGDKPLSEPMLA